MVHYLPIKEQPAFPSRDRCLLVVRIDPAKYRFRIHSGALRGIRRTAPDWAVETRSLGIINASMFQENLKSTGLLLSEEAELQPKDNPQFGGFFAFAPRRKDLPPVAFFGSSCPGFDLARIRRDYRSIVQNYRLIDCDGKPLSWKDPKAYSAAAIGMDADGQVAFLLLRAPYTMTQFARILSESKFKHAHFVEGGPETSVVVSAPPYLLRAHGSYETGFLENDSNDRFWELPNVLGFERY